MKIDLVCTRANEPKLTQVPAGTTYNGRCRVCDQVLAISPSGQRYIRDCSTPVALICLECYRQNDYVQHVAPAGYENDHAGPQVPNAWRRRN
jgi:hypothetical protein